MSIRFYSSSVRFCAFASLLAFTTQCSVSEQVKDAPSTRSTGIARPAESPKVIARENKAYEQVQYRLNFVDEARLGGEDILFARQATDLTSPQQAKLQTALQSGTLPLRLRMRLYARNPTPDNMQLQQMDYMLMLDGKEWLSGRTGDATALEAGTIITLPVAVDLNVTPSLLKGSTPAAFAAGLTDFGGTNRRLKMLIRPIYESAAGRTYRADDFVPVELVTTKR